MLRLLSSPPSQCQLASSSEVAQLTKGMSDNEAARSDATGIRDKENADFNLEEARRE